MTQAGKHRTLPGNGQQTAVGVALLKVMVSSNYTDMIPERAAVRDAILRAGMFPLMMETYSAAVPDRGIITNSWQMVDEADIYLVLLSNYRYGQIVPDSTRNPNKLSVTELEFDRAEARGLKPCVFVQDDPYDYVKGSEPSHAAVQREAKDKRKLAAFRTKAQNHERIVAPFRSVEQLEKLVLQTLEQHKTTSPTPMLRHHLDAKHPPLNFIGHQLEVPSQLGYTADAFGILLCGWPAAIDSGEQQDGIAYEIGVCRFSLDLIAEGCQTEFPRFEDRGNPNMAVRAGPNGWTIEQPDGRILDRSFQLALANMVRSAPDAEPSVALNAWAHERDFKVRPIGTIPDGEGLAEGIVALFLEKHVRHEVGRTGKIADLGTASLRWKPES